MGFTKLDENIITSTIWAEDSDTVRLWVYLLAATDSEGFVKVTIPALALHNRMGIARVEEILAKFSTPDPYSRSKREEGRRIQIETDPTFKIRLLNYSEYRSKDHTNAERQQRFREKMRNTVTPLRNVTPVINNESNVTVTQAEAEAEAEVREKTLETPAGRKKFTPPTPEEAQAYLNELGERRFTGDAFVDGYQQKGWKAKGGDPIKDWKAAARNWIHMRDQHGEPQPGSVIRLSSAPARKCFRCENAMTEGDLIGSAKFCRECRKKGAI